MTRRRSMLSAVELYILQSLACTSMFGPVWILVPIRILLHMKLLKFVLIYKNPLARPYGHGTCLVHRIAGCDGVQLLQVAVSRLLRHLPWILKDSVGTFRTWTNPSHFMVLRTGIQYILVLLFGGRRRYGDQHLDPASENARLIRRIFRGSSRSNIAGTEIWMYVHYMSYLTGPSNGREVAFWYNRASSRTWCSY